MGGESCRVLRLRWMRKLTMCLIGSTLSVIAEVLKSTAKTDDGGSEKTLEQKF